MLSNLFISQVLNYHEKLVDKLIEGNQTYLKPMISVFEKLIKTEKFIFITRQKISVGKLMMAKMLLRIGLRLFPGSLLVCMPNLPKK